MAEDVADGILFDQQFADGSHRLDLRLRVAVPVAGVSVLAVGVHLVGHILLVKPREETALSAVEFAGIVHLDTDRPAVQLGASSKLAPSGMPRHGVKRQQLDDASVTGNHHVGGGIRILAGKVMGGRQGIAAGGVMEQDDFRILQFTALFVTVQLLHQSVSCFAFQIMIFNDHSFLF